MERSTAPFVIYAPIGAMTKGAVFHGIPKTSDLLGISLQIIARGGPMFCVEGLAVIPDRQGEEYTWSWPRIS